MFREHRTKLSSFLLQIFILQAEIVHSEELEIAKFFTWGTILILTGGNVYPCGSVQCVYILRMMINRTESANKSLLVDIPWVDMVLDTSDGTL